MPNIVRIVVLDEITARLSQLPLKEREKISLREAIQRLQPTIRAVLNKGYSYDEVLRLFIEIDPAFGSLSATTLRRYMATARNKPHSTPVRARRHQSDGDVDHSSSVMDDGRPTTPRPRVASSVVLAKSLSMSPAMAPATPASTEPASPLRYSDAVFREEM